jgi:hypothetical protein
MYTHTHTHNLLVGFTVANYACNRQGYKGVGFYVTKQIRNRIMGFEPVIERYVALELKESFTIPPL